MLASFRKISHGIISKLLLGLLVLSFGIWGIGDVFRGGGKDNTIATVDGDHITQQDLDNLLELLKRNYTQLPADATKDPFFKLEILNSLVNDRLLRHEADRMGIIFSEDILARLTARNPMFQKADGSFDRKLFLLTLEQNNHTERSYLHKLRDEMARSLLQDTLQTDILAPEEMVTLYHAIREEEREATLLLITDKDVGASSTPDAEAIQAYFKENIDRYQNPEYRTLRYVTFTLEGIWKQLNLDPDDAKLKELYEDRKEAFEKPESRSVQQLLFASEEHAKKAHNALQSGIDFDKVSKTEDVTNKDNLQLGTVTRNELPPATADTVFALEKGAYSEPTKSSFGWHIFRVNDIIPAKRQSFEEIKPQLLFDYRAEHGEEKITELSNQIEDALAGGASMEDALKQAGLDKLTPKTLGPITATNKNQKGESVTLSKLEQKVLDTGYAMEEGHSSSLNVSEGTDYYLVQLANITPAQAKPIEEVKEELIKAIKRQETEHHLKKLALETAAKMKGASDAKAAFAESKMATYKSGRLKRSHDTVSNQSELKNKVLTSGFILELFSLKPGEVTGAYPLPSGEYVIGLLNKIYPARKPKESELEALKKELETALPEELVHHYLNYLRNKYAVSIRQDRLFEASEQK